MSEADQTYCGLENEGVLCRAAPACLLCGGEGLVQYARQRDRFFGAPGGWDVRWRHHCELAWLDPRPLPSEIGKLYVDYYTHGRTEQEGAWETLKHWLRDGVLAAWLGYDRVANGTAQRLVGLAAGWLRPVRDVVTLGVMCLPAERRGRLLDVGCGNGEFLVRMRRLGWEVRGVEPDVRAATIARETFGLEVDVVQIEDLGEVGSFDAVTLSHVLEHVVDPVACLAHCARLLHENGLLVVTTPAWGSLGCRRWRAYWRGLEVPRHIFLYAERSLREVAERAGLTTVKLARSGRSASWVWQISRAAARSGRVPGSLLKRDWVGFVQGAIVQLLESVPGGRHLGEELVLMATPKAEPRSWTRSDTWG